MWKRLWKTLHQSWLLVALCLGIIIGSILAFVVRSTFFISPYWLIFVAVLFLSAFFKPNYLTVIIIFLSGIILSFFRASADVAGADYLSQFVNETVTISGTISEDPDFDEDKTKLKLNDLVLNDTSAKGTLYVQISETEMDIQRSDKITLTGKMSDGFGSFSGSMYRPKIVSVARPEPGDLFLRLRNWFAEKIKQFVPEKESSLSLAYLLGMKNGLPDDVLEMLRIIGLTHIVVASGTHLGIIVSVVRKIFGKLSRFSGLLFSILFILVFGGIIGWTASIVRATIVTVLSLLMWYVGRKFEGWRIILIAMAVTLMINPMFITNLGWLLSFASFSGILILEPKLKEFFFGEKKINKLLEILLVTVSAQLACIPILIYYFGSISLISVVANVLILPTMPVVMGLTFLTGVFGGIEFLGMLLGKIVTFFIDYHLLVMNFFAEQKMFIVSFGEKNPLVFLIYVPIILMLLVLWAKKLRQKKLLTQL